MPESETLLLIAGLILVIVGALGGGLRVREISVPKIGRASRAISVLLGIVLVALGVGMTGGESGEAPDVAEGPAPYEGGYEEDQGAYGEDPGPYEEDQGVYEEGAAAYEEDPPAYEEDSGAYAEDEEYPGEMD